jgi:hypothetical protein
MADMVSERWVSYPDLWESSADAISFVPVERR